MPGSEISTESAGLKIHSLRHKTKLTINLWF